MSFLQFMKEDGEAGGACAVSTGSVAALFGGTQMLKRRKIKVTKLPANSKAKVYEAEGDFDTTDILAKLHASKKMSDLSSKTTAFGIEDSDGAITKVYVAKSQAHEFQRALADAIDDAEDPQDVAAVLFDLHTKFDIQHVVWPAIPEDAEPDADAQPGDAVADEMPSDDTPPADMATPAPDADSNSILLKVIAMLQSDAESKIAAAKAREAAANAKQAQYAAKIADAKVQGETELKQADAYFKQKHERKKETQALSRLAAYRQEISNDQVKGDYK